MDIAFCSARGLIDSAIYLLEHIEDNGYFKNTNKYSFILVSAASLESLLNDGIILWALNTFPRDSYKRHAEAFLSMNLAKKIDALGYLISAGKFITDNNNETYKTLSNLIKLRNEVAHSKGFFSEVDIKYSTSEEKRNSLMLPIESIQKREPKVLNISHLKCESIIKALQELEGILSYEIAFLDSNLLKPL